MADALVLARIRPCTDDDFDALAALWGKAGLTRPWNDPAADFERCRATPTAELFVLGAHMMFWEYPEEFNGTVSRFLDTHLPA